LLAFSIAVGVSLSLGEGGHVHSGYGSFDTFYRLQPSHKIFFTFFTLFWTDKGIPVSLQKGQPSDGIRTAIFIRNL
jgi:hypothetical protein